MKRKGRFSCASEEGELLVAALQPAQIPQLSPTHTWDSVLPAEAVAAAQVPLQAGGKGPSLSKRQTRCLQRPSQSALDVALFPSDPWLRYTFNRVT